MNQIFQKLIFIFILFSSLSVFSKKFFYPKFKEVSLQKVQYVDLCTRSKEVMPLSKSIDLWSIHCGNCLEKIADYKSTKLTLINVDQNEEDRAEACAWLKKMKLKSLVDINQSIKTQMGEDYPLPAILKEQNGKIVSAEIGYWRSQTLTK